MNSFMREIKENFKNDVCDLLFERQRRSNDKYVRPPFGHQKIETDLRQVPKEFIRLTNILYSFITVQYDSSLLNNKLLLNLIQSFYQLEESYSKSQSEKINSVKDGSRKLVLERMVCKIYDFLIQS